MANGGFHNATLDALLGNLISVWKLGEAAGATRVDSEGNNDLADSGTVGQAAGKDGNCADFTGGNPNRLSKATGFVGWPGAGAAYSMAFWMKRDTTPGGTKVLWASYVTGGYVYLRLPTDGYIEHAYWNGSTLVSQKSTAALTNGQWYHVACVYDGTKLRLWIDGTEQGTGAAASTPAATGAFYLGSDAAGAFYDGKLDEVYAFNVALSETEIQLLHNSGAGRFYHPYVSYIASSRGMHRALNAFGATGRGLHKSRYMPCELTARGAHSAYNSFGATGRGLHAITVSYGATSRGLHAVLRAFGGSGRGLHLVRNAYLASARGKHAVCTAYSAELQDLHRVANDALARYELYRGIDAAPDFTAAPWETFTTLPHATAALDMAPAGTERTYRFVLRARNAWNLASRNVAEWAVTVDDAGAVVTTRPSAPEEISVAPAAGGAVLVTARYMALEDAADAATQWLVYLRSNGTNPDPSVDTPTVVTMVKADGNARLSWESGAQADGATVKVIVRTRRVDTVDPGPPPVTQNVDSSNVDVYTAVADTDGPAAVTPAGIFFGTLYEQAQ